VTSWPKLSVRFPISRIYFRFYFLGLSVNFSKSFVPVIGYSGKKIPRFPIPDTVTVTYKFTRYPIPDSCMTFWIRNCPIIFEVLVCLTTIVINAMLRVAFWAGLQWSTRQCEFWSDYFRFPDPIRMRAANFDTAWNIAIQYTDIVCKS
jgi:hypothetical protein